MSESAAIEISELWKTFRSPLRQRRIDVVRGISLRVERGEIYGFLGPNGAGKTTTIRVLMGLIAASSGDTHILGHSSASRAAQRQLGFLPESPYFYDYLTVTELVDLAGRLFGLQRRVRQQRTEELIERVGLTKSCNIPIKKFSKGMLQRAGLAQSLINDPELLVFDEPMSGLDPVGRKEVRDLILSLRDQGKTVFFSSHILADVEMICDRVAIISEGKIRSTGTIRELVTDTLRATEIVFHKEGELDAEATAQLDSKADTIREREGDLFVELGPKVDVDAFLALAHKYSLRVVSVTPRHETLEDVFIRAAGRPAEGDS